MSVTKALPQDVALLAFEPLYFSGVSPMPFLPQDKECYGSDTSHAEKAVFFFKESTYISEADLAIVRFLD
jgi:hypothetical protein